MEFQDSKMITVRRVMKDSVFRDLFSERKYAFLLYQALHPEDLETSEEDVIIETLQRVLVKDIYNDLGFRVGKRLLILVEAQSTWSLNIIMRGLLYLVRTYQDYFNSTGQSLFSTRKVEMPVPELYVLYTGKTPVGKEVITLRDEFFEGRDAALDVRVKVIQAGESGSIINQYILFTRIVDEQVRLYGRRKEAVTEAIRICREQDVLKEYLERKEREVLDIMTMLYDEEEVWRMYMISEKRELTEEIALRLFQQKNMSVDEIAEIVNTPVSAVREWISSASMA